MMHGRTIVQGTTVSWSASFTDEDGTAVDMTGGTKSGQLRMRGPNGTTTTKSTGDSNDWTWSDQSSGTGYWTFTSTETAALAVGAYKSDVVYTDSSTTPDTKRIVGTTTISVRAPKVGAI